MKSRIPLIVFAITFTLSQLATFARAGRTDGLIITFACGIFFWAVNPFFGAAITLLAGLIYDRAE
jgi:hypothetical protein